MYCIQEHNPSVSIQWQRLPLKLLWWPPLACPLEPRIKNNNKRTNDGTLDTLAIGGSNG